MNLRPMTEEEHKYSYNQSTQLTGQTGCIGYFHGGFDAAGLFSPAWKDRRSDLNTDEFTTDRDVTLQAFCHDGCILSNRNRMMAYCLDHPGSSMDRESREYGFRADTDKYAYPCSVPPVSASFTVAASVAVIISEYFYSFVKNVRKRGLFNRVVPQSQHLLTAERPS